MKAKIFYDIESFNRWAKGKALTRNVIIHTLTWPKTHPEDTGFGIVVYHPEDPMWEQVKVDPSVERMVEQHIAGVQSAGE